MSEENKQEAGLSRRGFFKKVGVTAAGVGASAIAARLAGVGGAGLGVWLPSRDESAIAAPGGKFDAPTVTCGDITELSIYLNVCAGPSGAPAGFSIQWMTCDAYAANGNKWYASNDERLCKASFSGNANLSRYNLAPNECTQVNVGELLMDNGASTNCAGALTKCTCYVFRAFAHADSTLKRSDFTTNLTCTTLCPSGCPTPPNCTFTQGYWKTHGPGDCTAGNNTNQWPVTSLILGNVTYTDAELCGIMSTSSAGNGLITLAHQLIAAKLNIAKGADDSAISTSVAAADNLIGNLVVPPVGTGSLANSAVSSLVTALTNYNEGLTGPGHCCD